MITFLCPNGHKLSCPDHHGGRAGTCPDCGIRFRVPLPEPATGAESAPGSAAESGGDSGHDRGGESNLIVFLCPNGHRLNGPPNLAGRAGQCPHCGSRFRIPALNEPEPVETPSNVSHSDANINLQVDQPAYQSDDDKGAEIPLEEIEEVEEVEEVLDEPAAPSIELKHSEQAIAEEFAVLDRDQSPATGTYGLHVVGSEGIERPVTPAHPLAEMFERFWDRSFGDAGVEIKLVSGETLSPAYYASDLSQRSHASFAIREADGRFTLIAVPWDSVARIAIRGLTILPPEFN